MSDKILKAACVQLNNTPDIDKNLAASTALVRQAAKAGAQLAATPEYSCLMREIDGDRMSFSAPEDEHKVLKAYRDLAKELGIWILIGSLSIRVLPDKLNNRSFLIDAKGDIVARYNKIHLFDVDLPNGQSFRESKSILPGDKAVLAPTPWGKIGMTVCYDVRFPHLYRALAQAGASIITVPAAFAMTTGEKHWEIFLRSRAAETGCFVLAPGQCGQHEGKRKCWGHSMIIDPWGKILAEGSADQPGFITADLDLAEVAKYRQSIPAWNNNRDFAVQPAR
jgi:deaminated glutathione amidase